MRRLVLTCLFMFVTASIIADNSHNIDTSGVCVPENFAFQPGEEIEYTIYYNWGLIWVNAGLVNFSVEESEFRGTPAYYLDTYGRSHRWYDRVFRVRDRFHSYVEKETLRPLWHEMDTYEGGHEAWDVYNFYHDNSKVVASTEDSKRPRQIDTIDIGPCSYDIVTAAYIARNIDFSSYNKNDRIPFSILIRDELHSINPKFLGRETIETRRGGTYDCLKFSITLVDGYIFKGGDDLFIWVTDDDNRVPVMIEAELRVGSIKAVLKSYDGLRHPMSARVD